MTFNLAAALKKMESVINDVVIVITALQSIETGLKERAQSQSGIAEHVATVRTAIEEMHAQATDAHAAATVAIEEHAAEAARDAANDTLIGINDALQAHGVSVARSDDGSAYSVIKLPEVVEHPDDVNATAEEQQAIADAQDAR